ncbi:unnamed protein product, partial [Durusdinium trenchii]
RFWTVLSTQGAMQWLRGNQSVLPQAPKSETYANLGAILPGRPNSAQNAHAEGARGTRGESGALFSRRPASTPQTQTPESGLFLRRAPSVDSPTSEDESGSYLLRAANAKKPSKGRTKTTMTSISEGSTRSKSRGEESRMQHLFGDTVEPFSRGVSDRTPRGGTGGTGSGASGHKTPRGSLQDSSFLEKNLEFERGVSHRSVASSSAGSQDGGETKSNMSTSMLAKILKPYMKGTKHEDTAAETLDESAPRTSSDELEKVAAQKKHSARLLLDDGGMQGLVRKAAALAGSGLMERRQEALKRSRMLQEMFQDPQADQTSALEAEVDVTDLPLDQKSSEEVYWETLWKATKDMMRDDPTENTPKLDMDLLPEIPGSVDMPFP